VKHLAAFLDLDTTGSTRLLGLLRIALVLLVWDCWAYPFILHFDLHPQRVGLALLFYASSTLLLVGLWTPVAACLTAASLWGAILLLGDGAPSSLWLTQPRQLTALATLVLLPSPWGRSFSLDRWRALRHHDAQALPPPPERGPLWTLRLTQLVGAGVFLTSAIGQSNLDWLRGEAFVAVTPPVWAPTLAVLLLTANAAGALCLWHPRTRTTALAFVGAVYLALPTVMLTHDVPFVVLWLLAAWLPADKVHAAVDRLHAR
jgi:hypothetical protein